jgi:hypothetical protein
LQIDFLLLHKTQGELSEFARKLLAGLVDHLDEYTLIELKSPSDTLRAGDFRTLLAYALLYCAQNQETLDPARMTLIVVAPRLSNALAGRDAAAGTAGRLAIGGRDAGPYRLVAGNRRVGRPRPSGADADQPAVSPAEDTGL